MKTFAFIFLFFGPLCFAGSGHDHPVKVSPTFEKMKALVGTWEGLNKMHDKTENIKVVYELTSGGTAMMETMMPGTPHEMLTVYANQGNTVSATHYCAIGNQPQMVLKKAEGNTFQFEMNGTGGLLNKNEEHMHAVTLSIDGNKLKQEWTNYKDNKKGGMVVFEFTKKN